MPEALLPLDVIDPADPRFGGKATGLARLLRAGAVVPDGFAVAAGTVPPSQWGPDLRDRFIAESHALRAPIAVRSSALVEDQRDRSFAGLFTTVLDVESPEAALAAAERCIESGGSERVLAYAGSSRPLAVGLVVQRMASVRAAGVLFTRDPNGADGGMLLEAVAGPGEALVGGHQDPERFRIYRSGLGGFETQREPRTASAASAVLRDDEVERLATEAARLALALGEPLDLEWAITRDGSIVWLQARPITTLVDPLRWVIERSYAAADDGPVTVWSNWNVRETMPEPLHPLTWSLWRETILPFLTERFFGVPRQSGIFDELAALDRIQGRVYFNFNAALAIPMLGPLLRSMLHHVDYRAGAVIDDLMERGVLTPRRLHGDAGPSLASIRARWQSLPGTLRALRPKACLADLESSAAAIASRPAVESMDSRALLAELRLWESPDAGALRDGMQMLTVTLFVWMAADRLYAPYPDAQRLLVAGIRGNPTTEISVRLDELIEAAHRVTAVFEQPLTARSLLDALAASDEGRVWLERFDGFLAFCGQRGPREFDLAVPRWADDPTMVLDLVRLGLAEPGRERVGARLERLAREREAAIEAALRAAPLWKRPLLRAAAKSVAAVLPLREAPKHYGLHIFQRMRLAAIELGRRLARSGVLADYSDVFFLQLAELESSITRDSGLAAKIEERRRELADFYARAAPDFVRSDGVPVTEASEDEAAVEGELRGTGVSRGAAAGIARVLDRPDPNAFSAGDVLVVAFADPGWTPLFPRASALVMEVGGVMCHAAVVARELGIPAVFGVVRATKILAHGQHVSVDGSTGVVKVLDG